MHYDVKKAFLGIEPITYGSESECATHYYPQIPAYILNGWLRIGVLIHENCQSLFAFTYKSYENDNFVILPQLDKRRNSLPTKISIYLYEIP